MEAGASPNWSRLIWCLIKGLPFDHEAYSREKIAAAFFPLLNFWQKVRPHCCSLIMAALCSRALVTLQPSIILCEGEEVRAVRSQTMILADYFYKVFQCIGEGYLASWCKEFSCEELTTFYDGRDQSLLSKLPGVRLSDGGRWCFLEVIGWPCLLDISPERCCIVVPYYDAGVYKRHPLLHPLFARLSALARLVALPCEEVATATSFDGSRDSGKALLKTCMARVQAEGLLGQLETTTLSLRHLLSATMSSRTLAGLSRKDQNSVLEHSHDLLSEQNSTKVQRGRFPSYRR